MPEKFKVKRPNTIVCPHCFAEFKPEKVIFTNSSGVQATAKMGLMNRQLPDFIMKDGERLTTKLCPNCQNPLPYTAGKQQDVIIGMVGARASGKSSYVATLVQEVRTRVSLAYTAGLMHLDDDTNNRYKNEFYYPLYEHLTPLSVTQNGAKALLYGLTIRDGWIDDRAVTLSLYDTAGEDFATRKNIDDYVSYLTHAKGLIFVIDPLQVDSLRHQLEGKVALPDRILEGRPSDIIGNVYSLLVSRGLVDERNMVTIPVAVVFTKCDVLADVGIIPAGHNWHDLSLWHKGFYDLPLHHDMQNLFRELFEKWEPATFASLNVNFANYGIFGVSATGSSVNEEYKYPRIMPMRVEDPLLWLLYEFGVIPSDKDKA